MAHPHLPVLLLVWTIGLAYAQNACGAAKAIEPTLVAKGFMSYVLTKDVKTPRGIFIDKDDNLLVVERSKGISLFKLKSENNCMTVGSRTQIVQDSNLTVDGSRLFASSKEAVFSWRYEPGKATGPVTWITGMNQTGHQTRTLLASKKSPNTLLVSRGSGPNIDPLARDLATGVSQIRSFDISAPKKYDYTDGTVIGWGLRNSVGVGENPKDGGIWSNENSSDNMARDGKDIHETSPGEEINYHGTLAPNDPLHGKNYGYPDCMAAWDVAVLPRNNAFRVGTQFTHNGSAPDATDALCQVNTVSPRITLPSHWAPLDMAFNSKGSAAYMTAHGSWNKDNGDGYKVFAITFGEDGQPTHPPTSKTAHIPILSIGSMRTCGKGNACFRPVGLAFDSKGRLYMSSDASNEIYVIDRTDGRSVDSIGVQELEALERTEPPRAAKNGPWSGRRRLVV